MSFLFRSFSHLLLQLTKPTPRSRFFPEKLTVPQPVKKLTSFYRTRRFIGAFKVPAIRPYPQSVQSSPCPPSHCLKFHFKIILPSTPGYSQWSLSPGFPTKILYTSLLSPYMPQFSPISFFLFIIFI